ncbi:hypothetical protein [Xenorhabdus bovienii]|uniref:hypothetical protein n=1 Tax=Xenorhabdus bovienii TaxID=40576 RepID=UPI0023B235B8|nr:hypothetical protein [Xenorhabdus bovienii]MDE9463107.1 hypothetical protein [Xenorhabdus bovienii]
MEKQKFPLFFGLSPSSFWGSGVEPLSLEQDLFSLMENIKKSGALYLIRVKLACQRT